jgi:hypothetical protein
MTQTQTTPWFVADKRRRKADQIARAIEARGLDAADAVRMDDEQRREIEAAAGIKNKGSDRTWRAVVAMLAGSYAPGALCLTCGIGDPAGVDGPPKPRGHQGPCAK